VLSARRLRVIALTVLVSAPRVSAAPVRVETLAVRNGAVEIGLSSPVEPVIRRLESPPRVYVDLAGATLAPSVARALDGGGVVRQVRAGQHDAETARVVVELAESTPVDVETAGTTLRLVTSRAAPGRTVASRTIATSTPPAAATSTKPPAAATGKPTPPAPRDAPSVAARPPAPDVVGAMPADVPRLTVVRLDASIDGPRAGSASIRSATLPLELQERIARRAAADDFAGLVALYAAHPDTIRRDADASTRVAVVDALRELGLTYSARKLLGPATSADAPVVRVARAEIALAQRDVAQASGLVAGLDEAAVDPALVPKLRRVRVRLALARGDFDGAASGIGTRIVPELRAELAQHAIVAGRQATREHACGRAVRAFRQALEADGDRTARAAAGAGLVHAALVCRDADATASGLGVLAESPHPLLRRAATAIAGRQAAATGERGG
jgi:AMIN domain